MNDTTQTNLSLLEEQVMLALAKIEDPDLKDNIVSLGFVKDLKILGNAPKVKISFSIELTTPACPVKEDFRKQATQLVGSIAGIAEVDVKMTSRAKVVEDLHIDSPLKKIDSIVAVASCKGGVGKSTVSAVLASELAHRGFSVGLLDIDIFGPSLPTLFSIPNHGVQQKNGMILPLEVSFKSDTGEQSSLKLMSFGFLLGDAAAVMRGPMVANYLQQILKTVDWGELDYLFIDLPPGTGDIQLTLTQRIRLNGAVMVTTKAALAVVDVARGIKMFEKVNVPIYGLVDNMAYFKCHGCETKHSIFSSDNAVSLSEKFGLPLLGELPIMRNEAFNFSNYESKPEFSELVDELVKKIGILKHSPRQKPEVVCTANTVTVKLSEEEEFQFQNSFLRLHCPCAFCINEINGAKKISEEDVSNDIHATSSASLGNYAITLNWSDGHTSGIYSFELLRKLQAKNLHS